MRLLLLSLLLSQTAAEELATVAISTFLLELTIQSRPERNLRSNNSLRSLSQSADELIQSTAERHLSRVYGKLFRDPSQVLLTVVTTNNDNDTSSGFTVRSSFVGGVVSFPLSVDLIDGSSKTGLKVPSRSDISDATLRAFRIPGNGEDYLNDLLEAQHDELEGLLLVNAKSVSDGDSIEGYNGSAGGLSKVPLDDDDGEAAGTVDVTHEEGSSFILMDNIWAIAAVAALGAMFLTILMCTTILWCDWRKRKARKEKREEQKMLKQQMQQNAEQNDYFQENIVQMSTLQSEETNDTSPSNSDQIFTATPGHNVRNSIIHHIRKKSTTVSSKAAQNHLQLSRSIDDEDPSPTKSQEAAPSVVYSVGEDTTTMLYPAIHRGRQNSRDLSEFDGYSMDGMSAIGGSVIDSNSAMNGGNKQHPLLAQRNVMYSGDVPRDFDSVWDDESKMTNDLAGHERKLSIDDDSILGKSIGNEVPIMESVEPIVNLTNLNRLDEDRAANNPKFLNEFDDESESESSSNRGAFTLELLKGSSKSKRKSLAPEDDDSILGDIGGHSGFQMDVSTATATMEEVEEEDIAQAYEEEEVVLGTANGDGDESVDSTPSWAGRIKSALMKSSPSTKSLDQALDIGEENGVASPGSGRIFRPAADEDDDDDSILYPKQASKNASPKASPVTSPRVTSPTNSTSSRKSQKSQQQTKRTSSTPTSLATTIPTNVLGNQSSPSSVKDKFVSSLGLSYSFSRDNDDNSVSSARSGKSSTSHRSNTSRNSRASRTSNNSGGNGKALGRTNSMDEEVDEDPADMIENINTMLSECRVILDTDVDGPIR